MQINFRNIEKLKFPNKETDLTPSLGIYFSEIGRHVGLSKEEEHELLVRAQSGDQFAWDKILKTHATFVVTVAKYFRIVRKTHCLALSDLINEGNMGLLAAIRKYERREDCRFLSYAVHSIYSAILKSINRTSRIVRLPTNAEKIFSDFEKQSEVLMHSENFTPSISDIINVLQQPVNRDTVEAVFLLRDIVFLNDVEFMFYDSESGDSFPMVYGRKNVDDSFNPEKSLLDESISMDIITIFDTILSERQSIILRLFFGLKPQEIIRKMYEPDNPMIQGLLNRTEFSLEEIGIILDCTSERVRQIKEKAIKRIRNSYQGCEILRVHLS